MPALLQDSEIFQMYDCYIFSKKKYKLICDLILYMHTYKHDPSLICEYYKKRTHGDKTLKWHSYNGLSGYTFVIEGNICKYTIRIDFKNMSNIIKEALRKETISYIIK
jgi:hypothetical protein